MEGSGTEKGVQYWISSQVVGWIDPAVYISYDTSKVQPLTKED